MVRDSGWVEVLDPATNADVARAHLVVGRTPPDEAEWVGELRSVHSVEGHTVSPGRYILRFELGGELCCVQIEGDPPAVRGLITDLPTVVRELHASD